LPEPVITRRVMPDPTDLASPEADFGCEGLAFGVLAAVAALMAAGYVLDLAGRTMHPVGLALGFVAAGVAVGWTFRVTSVFGRTSRHAGFLVVVAASTSYFLWLASPEFLPVTIGPDVVHHLQLIHFIQRTHALPHAAALNPYLLEMMNYTPGSHILAASVADWFRLDALRVLQPLIAVFVAVKLGMLYLLALRVVPGSRSAPVAALSVPVLALVPAVYTIGSSFHVFFYAQVISETFAIGVLLAAVSWSETRATRDLIVAAVCGMGVLLSWPVWLGPAALTMIFVIVRAPLSWRSRVAATIIALGPPVLFGLAHALLHTEGGRILASSGAVTGPSVAAFGAAFLVLAAGGAILSWRVRGVRPVVVFLAAALLQAAALAVLAVRAGTHGFYLPFKMMYLIVFPAAVLGGVALIVVAEYLSVRVPRVRAAALLLPVVVAVAVAAGRVPVARQKSPMTLSALRAGVWAREHASVECVDYFTTHWLTGYWLHLDVLGNPRDSDRMRVETFEFRDSVGKWLDGRGLRYGIVEDLDAIPYELRPDLTVLESFSPFTVVRNERGRCPGGRVGSDPRSARSGGSRGQSSFRVLAKYR
jgi:hypothetical protein